MATGRPRKPPRRALILRMDEVLLAELYTFHPELQSASGGTKYGALTSYFTGLVVKDLDGIKTMIRRQAESKA